MRKNRREVKDIDGIIYIKCNTCWEFKEATIDNFDKNHLWYMWLNWFCKECRRKSQRLYRERNRERIMMNEKKFYLKNKEKLKQERHIRNNNKWYIPIHNKTINLIRKLWIKPNVCSICNKEKRIYAHHPDYNKWNEIVFCCQSCHQLIHSWVIECNNIINLLDYNK